MLFRLILLIIAVMLIYGGVRYWRSRRMLESGGLNVFEIDRMTKIAERSPLLKTAMMLRVNVVEASSVEDKKALGDRVDGVIRRLARQEDLKAKISKALAEHDDDVMERRVEEARRELEQAQTDDEREARRHLVAQLETQKEQLEQLRNRARELDALSNRIVLELRNLHLALLNASSSEAADSTNGTVQSVLNHLEEAGEELRQKAHAEDEVRKLIRATSSEKQG